MSSIPNQTAPTGIKRAPGDEFKPFAAHIPAPKASTGIEPGEKFLSLGEVLEMTSFRSKTSIYDLEKAGEFPARISLFGRRVAWLKSEVLGWMAGRVSLRDNATKKDSK